MNINTVKHALLQTPLLVILFIIIPILKTHARYSIEVLQHDITVTPTGEGIIKVTADGHSGPYTVYWPDNTTNTIDPNTGIATAIKGGLLYGPKTVIVENAHGCQVDLQATINNINGIPVSISALLEGPYNSISGEMNLGLNTQGYIPLAEPYTGFGYSFPANSGGGEATVSSVISNYDVVDWIVVELYDQSSVIWAVNGLLLKDGKVVDTDGVSDLLLPSIISNGGIYYVGLHHRNHVDVKAVNPIQVLNSNVTIDFSSPATNTTNQKQLNGNVFGLFAGDANYDNCVDGADRSLAWNLRNQTGYRNVDFNMNGTVDGGDRSIAWNNRNICFNPGGIVARMASTPAEQPSVDVGLNVYPNPFSERVTLAIEGGKGRAMLAVYNAAGQRSHQEELTLGDDGEYMTHHLELSTLPAGVYHVVLQIEGQKALSKKIIKTAGGSSTSQQSISPKSNSTKKSK